MKNERIWRSRRHQAGITLLELMIVVVIVAVLGAIAVPSYRDYVVRSNRADAVNLLLESAACQERIYIKLNRYDGNRCNFNGAAIRTQNGLYDVTIAVDNDGQGFNLTATAIGPQANDSCANLTLTDTGVRGTSASTTDADIVNCWKGRRI